MRLWVGATFAVVLVGALLTFGPLSSTDAFLADALVPIHVSRTRWEPYYWGQSRYGMLVPLIAMPLHEPLTNFLFQTWMTASLGVAFFFLLAAAILPERRAAAAGALSLALYVWLDDPGWHHFYLSPISQYGTGLSLALSGFLLWRRDGTKTRALGGILLLLALWVDVSVPLFIVPFAIGTWLARGEIARRVSAAIVGGWSHFVGDRIISSALFVTDAWALNVVFVPQGKTTDAGTLMSVVAPGDWISHWIGLGMNFFGSLPHRASFYLCALSILALLALRAPPRRSTSMAWKLAAILIGVVVLRWLFIGPSAWVELNGLHPKYLAPSRVALFALPGFLCAEAVAGRFGDRLLAPITAGAFLSCILCIQARHPMGSYRVARQNMEETPSLRTYGEAALSEGCTHFVGGDQHVWETAFYDAQVAYERGSRPIVGISFKSDPETVRWSALEKSNMSICSATEDFALVGTLSENLDWPRLGLAARRPNIDVWRVESSGRDRVHAGGP